MLFFSVVFVGLMTVLPGLVLAERGDWSITMGRPLAQNSICGPFQLCLTVTITHRSYG